MVKEYVKTQIKELYNKGLTDTEISKILKIHLNTIWLWRQENELPPLINSRNITTQKRKTKRFDHNKNEFLELYNDGYNDSQIAILMCSTNQTIGRWRKKCNLSENKGVKITDVEDNEKPWNDPNSLFCDIGFLEDLLNKDIKPESNCENRN